MSNRPYSPTLPRLEPTPDPQDKHFYSTDGTPIRVCHPDGDVALVDEPRTLPLKFHRLATKQGCQMRIVNPNETPAQAKASARKSQKNAAKAPPTAEEVAANPVLRDAAIAKAITDAVDSEENDPAFADAWTDDEKVNLHWLSERVGFGVDPDERDAILARVLADGADDEETDDKGDDA